ncbi:MAG: aminotransferase class III-fold pyridoxal phosphate-dependent enzyme [Thermoflexibacter sp.]|nr:aminotransferase class III-fold pyridoxal phosphate-dependent enzyme [Thermoflexibacter sp.]
MKLFNVYELFDIELVKAQGSYVWDKNNIRYLDLYGGHAVISIGHTHPHYVSKITKQLQTIAFYSNSIQIPIQQELANKLGKLSGYPDYELFLTNSGAESNENALKLASFYNKRKKVIALRGAFHGRTEGAVVITDNPKIVAPINETNHVIFIPFDDIEALEQHLATGEICAVIAEGIQGVGGIFTPSIEFWQTARRLCTQYDTVLIADEVQSGYGRTGRFFAHQHAGIQADLITTAKGMGNGFPIGGVLINPKFKSTYGMLGTTFGGNHLACAAGMAVLEVIESEDLVRYAGEIGTYWIEELKKIEGVREVRGTGLMIGIALEIVCKEVRNSLVADYQIFTGSSADKYTIRLLPALNIGKKEVDFFNTQLADCLQKVLAVEMQ